MFRDLHKLLNATAAPLAMTLQRKMNLLKSCEALNTVG